MTEQRTAPPLGPGAAAFRRAGDMARATPVVYSGNAQTRRLYAVEPGTRLRFFLAGQVHEGTVISGPTKVEEGARGLARLRYRVRTDKQVLMIVPATNIAELLKA